MLLQALRGAESARLKDIFVDYPATGRGWIQGPKPVETVNRKLKLRVIIENIVKVADQSIGCRI